MKKANKSLWNRSMLVPTDFQFFEAYFQAIRDNASTLGINAEMLDLISGRSEMEGWTSFDDFPEFANNEFTAFAEDIESESEYESPSSTSHADESSPLTSPDHHNQQAAPPRDYMHRATKGSPRRPIQGLSSSATMNLPMANSLRYENFESAVRGEDPGGIDIDSSSISDPPSPPSSRVVDALQASFAVEMSQYALSDDTQEQESRKRQASSSPQGPKPQQSRKKQFISGTSGTGFRNMIQEALQYSASDFAAGPSIPRGGNWNVSAVAQNPRSSSFSQSSGSTLPTGIQSRVSGDPALATVFPDSPHGDASKQSNTVMGKGKGKASSQHGFNSD
ncbi:hypothetical protein DL93DRAFT_2081584, partial [Clavulina sp. PMI_390]